jgi:hypothetical protein
MCDLGNIGRPNARITLSWAFAFLRVAASYGDEINVDDMMSVLASHSLIATRPFGPLLIYSHLDHQDGVDQHEDNHRSVVFGSVPASKDT